MDKDPVYIKIKLIIFIGILTDGALLTFFMIHSYINHHFDLSTFKFSLSMLMCVVCMNWFLKKM